VLPDWLDPDTLRWMILGAVVLLGLVMLMILRMVRKLIVRTALLAIIAGFGLSLWIQRADLETCVQTCSCSLYGKDLSITLDQLPQAVKDRIEAGDAEICPDLLSAG